MVARSRAVGGLEGEAGVMKRALGVVALGITALAGCGGAPEGGAPVTSSSSSAPLGEVATISDLRDAAVAAGMSCPSWVQTNAMTYAAESGECATGSGNYVLSTYVSASLRDQAVQGYKDITLEMREALKDEEDVDPTLVDEEQLLVGPNWMIAGNVAESLQGKLGGQLARF